MTELLVDTLREFTIRIEPLPGFWERKKYKTQPHPSAAMYYLDLGRLTANAGWEMAQRFHQQVKDQHDTDCSIGLAKGKFPAFIAARYATSSRNLIRPGYEGEFLSPLSINLLPLGKELNRACTCWELTHLENWRLCPKVGAMQLGRNGHFCITLLKV